ncbi:hypothetical protein [Natronolimnohabitans innermongolicus]|uniref:Uncharacterized protein n=1 Tax=Natronolimnohabitans innermongolicus JCM 12255 TaxID=1227499 RepID=L9WW44_9EURY|nr:hypothetical protein [Natronolimnohabitans innermongolicus]ELY53406.1 hypothetical protein C493_14088 [Natronolimnohabitans innermongolicus JCM 12255]
MSIDGWRSPVAGVTDRWRGLERDWQSVVVGATIVALVGTLEIPIPW